MQTQLKYDSGCLPATCAAHEPESSHLGGTHFNLTDKEIDLIRDLANATASNFEQQEKLLQYSYASEFELVHVFSSIVAKLKTKPQPQVQPKKLEINNDNFQAFLATVFFILAWFLFGYELDPIFELSMDLASFFESKVIELYQGLGYR